MAKKHRDFIFHLKGRNKIRVVYLVIHESVWKLDTVFHEMCKDPFFDPVILICPNSYRNRGGFFEELKNTYDFFKRKKYPVISSYSFKETRWIGIKELNPDIVFFTNPHNITFSEYYNHSYKNYLSCYAGYGIPISKYKNYIPQYDQFFHNAMWKIFVQHNEALAISKKIATNKGENVELSGDTKIEELLQTKVVNKGNWKKQKKEKIKMIWAPHHTINSPELPYSNFFEYADFFLEISVKYQDAIQWAFKPHPILKRKLYKVWGVKKTEDYYNFWKINSFTQLEEGEYIDLFWGSTAMIHDSAAFLGEYPFTKKITFYLAKTTSESFLNPFALDALSICYKVYNVKQIEHYLNMLISKKLQNKGVEDFIKRHSDVLGDGMLPSKRITASIKNSLLI
nr:hypothetical protein [Candidatus Electrothrix aestuarii]